MLAAGQDLAPGGIQQVVPGLGQDHADALGCVDDGAAAHGNEAVALGIPVELGDVVDDLDGGIRRDVAVGLSGDETALLQGGLDDLDGADLR